MSFSRFCSTLIEVSLKYLKAIIPILNYLIWEKIYSFCLYPYLVNENLFSYSYQSFSEALDLEEQAMFGQQKLHTKSLEIDGEICLEIPSLKKRNWILKNCRNAADDPVGYQPELYKTWTTGRKSEEELQDVHEDPIDIDFLIIGKVQEQNIKKSKLFSFIRKPLVNKWKSEIAARKTDTNVNTTKR